MATASIPRTIGPADHGRKMTLARFAKADFQEGWLYELARGVIDVTEVPPPEHGRIVMRVSKLFVVYDLKHPGVIDYRAGGGECRIRLPGMQSDRHPDQAVYLMPQPSGKAPWTRWIPTIVVEIVSPSSTRRDYEEKREEYLRVGILEYWIIDPRARTILFLRREGDVWSARTVAEGGLYRTELLPGLIVRPAELLGDPPADDKR